MDRRLVREKIESRKLTCAVVGLGYVGLPLLLAMARAGFDALGVDVHGEKAKSVNEGKSYIGDVADQEVRSLVEEGLVRATTDFSLLADRDFIALCVPTPLDSCRQPDTSFMEDAARCVAPFLKDGAMVVLESTTYPGTTEQLIVPLLEQGSGLQCGNQLFVGFSPERVDPGNPDYKTGNTPKLVGAFGEEALDCIAEVYEAVLSGGVIKVSTPAVAEMAKLLENTYRNVNIGLINEMAMLCERLGIDVWEVIEAASTKPYGFAAFYPGPGPGGHCIPLDPSYLTWCARQHQFCASLIEASNRVNAQMPDYCASRAARLLKRHGRSIEGAEVLVLGVAYKENIGDCRESAALDLIECLERHGAQVSYFDPWVKECVHHGIARTSLPDLSVRAVESADLILVACAHAAVDYGFVQKHGKLIFDTRNAFKDVGDHGNIEVL